jgi:hypothetical protein
MYYNGEESIFDTIENIVNQIRYNITYVPTRIKILNPVNSQEDFTDKWDTEPAYYEAFKKFTVHLYQEWQELKKEHGILAEGRILKGLFGDDLFANAQKGQTTLLESYRKDKNLGVSRETGSLVAASTAASIPVKTNTFFGA